MLPVKRKILSGTAENSFGSLWTRDLGSVHGLNRNIGRKVNMGLETWIIWVSERKLKLTERDVSVTIFTKWEDVSKQEKGIAIGKWQWQDFQGSSVGMQCCCLVLDEDNIMSLSNEWQSHLEGINKQIFFNLFLCINSGFSQADLNEMQWICVLWHDTLISFTNLFWDLFFFLKRFSTSYHSK